MFCDDQSHSARLLHNSGCWRISKIPFIQQCFGVLQVLSMKTKLHSEKKGKIQSRQMSISSTILFPLGLLRDPPRGSIPCQKLFYPKSDQEKIYISFVFTYYTYLHFLNITVAERKKILDPGLLSAFNCPNSIFFPLKKFTSPLQVLWKLDTVHVPQATIHSQGTKSFQNVIVFSQLFNNTFHFLL